MFGYITPQTSTLLVKEHIAYKAVYCGICRACGKKGSAPCAAKLSLRYDTVALALFRLMLRETPPRVDRIFCPLHPFSPRFAVEPCDEVRSAARHGALLFSSSLADHQKDESGMRRLAYSLLLPYASHLRRKTTKEDSDRALYALMTEQLSVLSDLEAQNCPSPDRVAHPFSVILGAVFESETPPKVAPHAKKLGYHIGRWITFADALDDLETDRKSGNFNPFLTDLDLDRIESAMRLDLQSARTALDAIEGGDVGCRAILENILTASLPEKTTLLLQKAAKGSP